MKVSVVAGPKLPDRVDLKAVPVLETKRGPQLDHAWLKAVPPSVSGVLGSGSFQGRRGEQHLAHAPRGSKAPPVLFIGVGKSGELDAEACRRFGGVAGTFAVDGGYGRVAILVPGAPGELEEAARAGCAAEGAGLGAYRFDRYRADLEEKRSASAVVVTPTGGGISAARRAVRRANIITDAVNLCRDVGNLAPNELGPEELADMVKTDGTEAGLRVRVLEEPALRKEGMEALLSVARGSSRPARMMVLEHRPKGSRRKPIVLVGKAITFDTGGISLKGREGMEGMKFDLGGGAAVFGAMCAIGRLAPDRPVIGLIAAAENMPGGSATRPGDVVKSAAGITIEITNTDAEGRLVLADALHYAKRYEPALVVDLATLTGACVMALGNVYAGLFTRETTLRDAILSAAADTGERFWPLPVDDDYVDGMKGIVADLRNSAARMGGASLAAGFLYRFIEGHPWVHLDIAPTAATDKPSAYQRHGATGFGVRTLVELAESFRESGGD